MDLVSLLLHSEDKSIRIFCYKHRIGGFFNFTLTNYWALYIMFYSFSFVGCGPSACLYHHAFISGTHLRLRKKLCVVLLDLVVS